MEGSPACRDDTTLTRSGPPARRRGWLVVPHVSTCRATRLGAMATHARHRALRAAAGGGIDAEAVAATARGLGLLGWVRSTGEIHAEGAPDALQALMASLGDAVPA